MWGGTPEGGGEVGVAVRPSGAWGNNGLGHPVGVEETGSTGAGVEAPEG